MINQSLPPKNRPRVLVVEDSPVNQKLLASFLKPLDCEVLVVDNGQEAVDQFHAGEFDIVFMDVQMPVMDGLTATRLIRKMEAERRSHAHIVAVTAGGERKACLDAGMDDYVAKPVRVQLVHDVLRLAAGQSPETSTQDVV